MICWGNYCELNLTEARRVAAGDSVTPPGLPATYLDPPASERGLHPAVIEWVKKESEMAIQPLAIPEVSREPSS